MSTSYDDVLSERLAEGLQRHATSVTLALREARRTCITCYNFDDKTETCGVVKPPMRPPAHVIAFGCPKYELLPF
jgi:hypothetical protein